MINKRLISVVLPCYNESQNIEPLLDALKNVLPEKYNAEYILIDDGSKDNTLEVLRKLADNNKNIKVISMYRNFGHQSAIIAGLMHASGDLIINMDADFQHPPELIPDLIKKYEEGYDLVVCKKENLDPSGSIYRYIRKISYTIFGLIGENKIVPATGDFRLMDKAILNSIKLLKETRFIPRGLVMLYAKKVAYIPYKVQARRHGVSGYNLVKHWTLYMSTITSFTIMPLRMATGIGLLLITIASIYLTYVLIMRFVLGSHVIEGFTAIIFVQITLFGFLFFYLGILSEYVGALFDEIKSRPKYIIKETHNINEM